MIKGIDISHYQTVTDWDKLAQSVDFVILKATQGHALSSNSYNFTDSKFHEYIKELIKRSVPVGAYHFFTGQSAADAVKEADYFCSVIAPYKDKLIYAVCDAENYGNKYLLGLSKAQLSANITAFCDRVKANGYKAAHYTNTDHVQSYINAGSIHYPMWRAHYQSNANAEKPPFSLDNVIAWQYSSTGSVPGIKNATDLNFGYFTVEAVVNADTAQTVDDVTAIHEGDTVKIKTGAMYKNDVAVPSRLYGIAYTAGRVVGDNVYIAILNSWVQSSGLELVKCRAEPDYAGLVCDKCGFAEQTREYIDAYAYAPDLWRKLWENMK